MDPVRVPRWLRALNALAVTCPRRGERARDELVSPLNRAPASQRTLKPSSDRSVPPQSKRTSFNEHV